MNSAQRNAFCDTFIPRLVNFTQVCTSPQRVPRHGTRVFIYRKRAVRM
mgnify:CR=1 FL=1